MKTTILNTSIITTHGSFIYKVCSLEQAKKLVASGFESAIGHDSAAAVISTLLDIDCKTNRIQYKQQPGDTALVFKLKARAPEGKILSAEEIEEIGYEWGLLIRTDQPETSTAAYIGECFQCSYVGVLDPNDLDTCPICGNLL
jgi:hypothetical protein